MNKFLKKVKMGLQQGLIFGIPSVTFLSIVLMLCTWEIITPLLFGIILEGMALIITVTLAIFFYDEE